MDLVFAFIRMILRGHLLSAVIFLPLAAALFLLLVPGRFRNAIRAVALMASLATLVLCGLLFARVTGAGELQLLESAPWIPSLAIFYRVGCDGISMPLMVLTALLVFVGLIVSWREIDRQVKAFHILILIAASALLGLFAALDMFLFYVFWDAALIPMCLIIAIWGSGGCVRAATKFILFTMAGGLAMLVAILYAGWTTGSFDLIQWYAHRFTIAQQFWLFAAFGIAFGVKVPLLGIHTWLPDAHAEAPTAGSVLLAGVFLKMGAYGFYRIALPLFPAALAEAQGALLILAVAGVIGGALIAMVQTDLKRLIAYTSISHMGLVMLGLLAREAHAAVGATVLMVAHGLTSAGLFIGGGMLFSRRHTRAIDSYGGTARALPVISVAFIVVALAALGLPGLCGFAGEFPILLGAFQSVTPFAAIAAVGIVLMAACMLWAVQRVFLGPLAHEEERKLPDMRAAEAAAMLPILFLIVAIGVWPKPFVGKAWQPAKAFVMLAKRVEMIIPAFPEPPRVPAQETPAGLLPMPNAKIPETPAEVEEAPAALASPTEEVAPTAAPEKAPTKIEKAPKRKSKTR